MKQNSFLFQILFDRLLYCVKRKLEPHYYLLYLFSSKISHDRLAVLSMSVQHNAPIILHLHHVATHDGVNRNTEHCKRIRCNVCAER